MDRFFASLYEWVIYHDVYSLDLNQLNAYFILGILFAAIPLAFMLIFYLLWKYPRSRPWHWLLWWLLAGVIVTIISYSFIASKQIFATYLLDPNGYPDFRPFMVRLILLTGLYSLITGFLYSMLLKRIKHSAQNHLPFIIKRNK